MIYSLNLVSFDYTCFISYERKKMKKKLLIFWTIALTSIGIFSLSISADKTENLTEKFTTLSREIVNQNLYVPETLENLKKMFTSCAESAEKAEVKTACQERLHNYSKLRSEFLPTKLEVSLSTGDVQLKKLGEVVFDMWPCWWIWVTTCTETGDEYEVNIPKYDFTFRFPLEKDKHNEQALKERNWVQSGNIAIPSEALWRHSQNPWLKDKHLVSNLIGFYSIPEFTGDAILTKVGEEYRKVYQEVYRLRDWRNFMKILVKNREEMIRNKLTGDELRNWEEETKYVISGGNLPLMTYYGGQSYFNVEWTAPIYWIHQSVDICRFDAENAYHNDDIVDAWWVPLPNCKREQELKWWSYQPYIYYPLIFRETKHPQVIKVRINYGTPPANWKRIHK